jgi:Domain of unknown function (DUF4124)
LHKKWGACQLEKVDAAACRAGVVCVYSVVFKDSQSRLKFMAVVLFRPDIGDGNYSGYYRPGPGDTKENIDRLIFYWRFMNDIMVSRKRRIVGGALLIFLPLICSAQVYKCTDNGSTTYQSEPCKGDGKVMQLEAGPSEQKIQEARDRADKEKKAAWTPQVSSKAQGQRNLNSPAPPDCDKLNKSVDDLQAQGKQLDREAFNGTGNPRLLNKLGASNQQQYNSALQSAQSVGCRPFN